MKTSLHYITKRYCVIPLILGSFFILMTACIDEQVDITGDRIEPPTKPTAVSPANDANSVIGTSLIWNESITVSDVSVVYDLYFGEDNPPGLIGEDLTDTSFNIAGQNLQRSTKYYWQVVAKADRRSTPGDVWSFTYLLNTAPPKPQLLFPSNAAALDAPAVTLSWRRVVDADGDNVSQTLFFGESNPPPVLVADIQGTSHNLSNLVRGKKYYWKVAAKDDKGANTESDLWLFDTNPNQAPSIARVQFPTNAQTNVPRTPTLAWLPSVDPDGDAVTYEIRLGTNNPPGVLEASFTPSAGASVTYTPNQLMANTTYYFQVIARDDYTQSPQSSTSTLVVFTTGN